MIALFQKLKRKAVIARTQKIEKQIERVREEKRSLKEKTEYEHEVGERMSWDKLQQKEVDDLREADKILRTKPIRGEDPIQDLKALSKILSHIITVSDTGEHVREKETLLTRTADAASAIRLRDSGVQALEKMANVMKRPDKDGSQVNKQNKAISGLLEDIVENIRNNDLLAVITGINQAISAIHKYQFGFDDLDKMVR
jgi:hypothetical protein